MRNYLLGSDSKVLPKFWPFARPTDLFRVLRSRYGLREAVLSGPDAGSLGRARAGIALHHVG